jgi:hypothetical protein
MSRRALTIVFAALLTLAACNSRTAPGTNLAENMQPATPNLAAGNTPLGNSAEKGARDPNQPKTVREFFMALPDKYFTLEGCEPVKDKGCKKAKQDYLQNLLEAEDTGNGYLKGGCDGAQECIEMALFKRPDGSYIVGVTTEAEDSSESYFLDYNGGAWIDISSKAVPQYSKKNFYQMPRYGTTVDVFSKKTLDENAEADIGDKGEKLYDLEWKGGKFSIKK